MIKEKNITKIIAIILLVSMILRFCFVIIHLNHDCTHDDNCPICALIHKFKDDLNGFDPNLVKVVIAILLIFPKVAIYLTDKIRDKKKETLVGLKVELIN